MDPRYLTAACLLLVADAAVSCGKMRDALSNGEDQLLFLRSCIRGKHDIKAGLTRCFPCRIALFLVRSMPVLYCPARVYGPIPAQAQLPLSDALAVAGVSGVLTIYSSSGAFVSSYDNVTPSPWQNDPWHNNGIRLGCYRRRHCDVPWGSPGGSRWICDRHPVP